MAQTTFAYKVRDTSGKLIGVPWTPTTAHLVATRLRPMGYVPVEIAAKAGASGAMKKDLHLPGMGGRVPLKVLALFSRHFATLVNAGLT